MMRAALSASSGVLILGIGLCWSQKPVPYREGVQRQRRQGTHMNPASHTLRTSCLQSPYRLLSPVARCPSTIRIRSICGEQGGGVP